jgi:diguanylate cyclase (GGDEF)-like protein
MRARDIPDGELPREGVSALGPRRRAQRVARHGGVVWRVAYAILAAAAAIAAALGARAIADNDASSARHAFAGASERVAARLDAALEREQELSVSAATYFAANPHAPAQAFTTWARWAGVADRYPELRRLELVVLLSGSKSPASRATRAVSAPPSAASSSLRCVIVADSIRATVRPPAASTDLCARQPALLATRDSGESAYGTAGSRPHETLEILTPVYRGGFAPSARGVRRAAFVGWLREIADPQKLLARGLASEEAIVLRLHHRGSFGVTFETLADGAATQGGAQSSTTNLSGGWTLRTSAAPVDAAPLENGDALALLIAGLAFGALLAGLALARGGSARSRPDSTDAHRAEELYDALTGLPNRALTLDRAERMIARAGRDSGVLAGAVLIDIDWFADVNERFGRKAGDQLLRGVAQRLQTTLRAQDSIGRIGGDEFAVLVEAARGVRFDVVARRVLEALHEPLELTGFGPNFVLTASLGVAFGRYASTEDLLNDARLALVAAKSAGKDRYTLFNANMRSIVEERGVLEAELNAALSAGQLSLTYEPIRDLRSRAVVGFEATVQWHHPERGVLPAPAFAALADETRLDVPIGRWALEEACSRAAEWNLGESRLAVAVKVSANQLNRDGFSTDVRRALQQSGLEPPLLTLEIAESTVLDDLEVARARLAQVTQLGVSIAIDDFGNGYAFRSDLEQMAIDCIKVDRASLAESEDEDYRDWLLEAILSFGRDLSMNVIATGVETPAQLGALCAMGFPMAQGAAVGAAVPADGAYALATAPLPAPFVQAPHARMHTPPPGR